MQPGILVPDIPLEETGDIREAASSAGLELVLLTTPTTPRERMQAIAKASQGFVYLVSVTGVRNPHSAVHHAVACTTTARMSLVEVPAVHDAAACC